MFTVHGTFDLASGVTPTDFVWAFDEMCRHLAERAFLIDWQFSERFPHAGYDRLPPETRFHMAMSFPDEAAMLGCYAYVAADDEPLRGLHKAIKTKVALGSQRFFMLRTRMPLLDPSEASTGPSQQSRRTSLLFARYLGRKTAPHFCWNCSGR